jgi:hypothetical protein
MIRKDSPDFFADGVFLEKFVPISLRKIFEEGLISFGR